MSRDQKNHSNWYIYPNYELDSKP